MRIKPRLRCAMPGAINCVTFNVPVTFMVMISFISSDVVWRKGTGMEWLSPTLLTRMDTSRPEVSFSRAWKSESLFRAKSMARVLV